MTDKETVAVPLALLKQLEDEGKLAVALKDLIPKPKLRLVAVTREQWMWEEDYAHGWFDDQPDVMEVLEKTLDYENISQFVRQAIIERFRYLLGISD